MVFETFSDDDTVVVLVIFIILISIIIKQYAHHSSQFCCNINYYNCAHGHRYNTTSISVYRTIPL